MKACLMKKLHRMTNVNRNNDTTVVVWQAKLLLNSVDDIFETSAEWKEYAANLKAGLKLEGERSGLPLDSEDESHSLVAVIKVTAADVNKAYVQISGDLLDSLRKVCGPSLQLHLTEGESSFGLEDMQAVLRVGEKLQGDKNGVYRCDTIVSLITEEKYRWMLSNGEQGLLPLTLSLLVSSGALRTELEKGFTSTTKMYGMILNDALFSDITVSSKAGREYPCHKAVLAARSPSFSKMLMDTTDTIKLDMNDDAVKAFLSFLYTGDIQEPYLNPEIALDLLKAGHKYEVTSLQSSMCSILATTTCSVITVPLALRMFRFTRNVVGLEAVMKKAAEALKRNSGGVDPKDYKSFFQQEPQPTPELLMEVIAAISNLT